ncbi:MAG: hypothetical protein FP818_12025 [Rhodocyclaceae bacterium]|nr:hypothetical protein [Rhodocyclaceae bacterium]
MAVADFQDKARIRAKHYSIRTETQCVQWAKQLIVFHAGWYCQPCYTPSRRRRLLCGWRGCEGGMMYRLICAAVCC